MCSISVEPMPSMMRTPVRSVHAVATAAGSGSPAETHARNELTRGEVGAAQHRPVHRRRGRQRGDRSGARWRRRARPATASRSAPWTRPRASGTTRRTPRPKVNARAASPVNTSSSRGRRTRAPNVSHVASRSRCRCTQPFGSPGGAGGEGDDRDVLGVGRHRLDADARRRRARPAPYSRIDGQRRHRSAAHPRVGQRACETCALPITFCSSPARSSGIVATTTPPASRIPNQQAISSGEFGPCSSTRLPGTRPSSPTSARDRLGARAQLCVRPRPSSPRTHARSANRGSPSSTAAALSCDG